MKNIFIEMALMAAAMASAFRENKMRDAGMWNPDDVARGSRGPVGKKNPAGSKFILRAFKAKHGHKADSIEEARAWYSTYLADKDAAVRAAEQKKRLLRAERRDPMLRLAA